jgi:hypothetical protein
MPLEVGGKAAKKRQQTVKVKVAAREEKAVKSR